MNTVFIRLCKGFTLKIGGLDFCIKKRKSKPLFLGVFFMSVRREKKEITLGKMIQRTFKNLWEEHLQYCKINNLSSNTLNTYKVHINYFQKFIGENALC